ncbi:arsenate reductase (glutaredoxin) [Phaeocystidibacter luteus]|uniref:Arsenate reductase (Glutaredoxin) n=1 Tax=Phaeocystidibacter luteus TaxID=911197 RepID=A0A6N6RGX4_9FLAO|nr:arsenate reductase (glutaredoxin) [Phaeocystidibacter luteus]KAB2810363.1 arsenate reductase (glutaredoxin) [Phaeocystidibacter luteus]
MIRVYHNPRCTKSREAVKYLEEKGVEAQVVEYMKEPLTPNELEVILDALDMEPMELIRTNEAIWKEEFKGKELDDDELILAMIEYPKLMQRPIVMNGDKAVVARPAEKSDEVL